MRSGADVLLAVFAMLAAALVAPAAGAATLVVSNNNDVVNGDTSSPQALIASPGADGISLREAIEAANNAPGPHTVTFAPALAGATIALTTRFAPITRDGITITGLTSNGQPNITIDPSAAANPGPILFIAASSFSMSGLRFPSIPTGFVGMQIGGTAFGLQGQVVTSPPLVSNVRISGNSFSNGTGNNVFAIFVSHSVNITSNATIANVVIADNSFDQLFEAINFQAAGTNNVIRDVTVYGNSFSHMTAFAGVELGIGGSGNQIRRARVLQNTFSDSEQGVYLFIGNSAQSGVIDDTEISRNSFVAVTQPAVGLGVGGGSSGNNTITNTRIVNNVISQGSNPQQSGGLFIGNDQYSPGTNNTISGLSIANNTIFGPFAYGAISVVAAGGVSGIAVLNTIFSGNQVNGLAPAQVGYSIINQGGFTGVNNNFNADPLFVNAGAGDFHLQAASPARGAGTSAGAPAIDADCQPRGAPPSIGAYEFNGPNICSSVPVAAIARAHDFDGGGNSDLAWRHDLGTAAIWLMNGAQVTQSGSLGTVPTSWQIVGQRDFNGDGKHDWLWRDGTTGTVAIWLLNGLQVSSSGSLGTVPGDWVIFGTGDVNGDGKGDILWRNTTTGTVAIWLLNGLQVIGSGSLGVVPTNWVIAGVGDFNGDGKWDILWRDTTTGTVAIWLMNGLQVIGSGSLGVVPAEWVIAGTGDFDGDGRSDLLWRNTTTGTVAIWLMNGLQVAQSGSLGTVPAAWSIAETGDFNGDGKSDLLWRNTSTGATAIWFLNGLQVASSAGLGTVGLDWTIQGLNAD